MGVALVLLVLVLALFEFAGSERNRAIRVSRKLTRASCAQSGLLAARSYFSANVANWNTYLSDPAHYNPVPATWITAAAKTPADPTSAALQTSNPELFFDLDGDGAKDVYIYMRDNQDELLPAANDWTRDNDQNVIVGAVCISNTMTPLLPDGQVDSSQLTAESLLSYNAPGNTYASQANGGASGTGNVN